MPDLQKSLRPVASFTFLNTDQTNAKKLCLFPGHFVTATCISRSITTTTPAQIETYLSYANPNSIKAAGYECDQVADDYSLSKNYTDKSGVEYSIKVSQKSQKTRYRDFLNFIKLTGVRVTKMRITDLNTNSDHAIFNSEIEISKSSIGSKAGSDFIQLSSHIDPSNFLQNFIEVDLEERNLLLDETTLAFIEIPAGANFQIDFTLA